MDQPSLFPFPDNPGSRLTDDELEDLLQQAMLTSCTLTAWADMSLAAIGARFLVNRLRHAGVRAYRNDPTL
jgi:hypothetical protein